MIDLHNIWEIHDHSSWWILPFINIFWAKVSTYSIFVMLWLIVWISTVIYLSKKEKRYSENMIYVVFAWIVGWILWAKIPIWIWYFDTILNSGNIESVLSGRTITWWLIWWTLAVIFTKRKLWIKTRFWNNLVPWIILWIAIWRIGCFLTWCCHWEVTTLPWWVDFWDGLFRHPTQAYEFLYLILLFIWYLFLRKKENRPWFLFDLFLIFYFWYRFIIEFIRVEPKILYGFTWYQIASILVVSFVSLKIYYFYKKNKKI